MIVCVCKNINSAQILESVRSGASSVEDVKSDTGASSCCGKCQFKVNRIIQDELLEQTTFYDAAAQA